MLLLFDLDGTLIDSVADIATASNALRAEYRLTPLPVATVARFVGSGVEKLVRQLLAEREGVALADAVAHYRRAYERHCLDQTRPYPGVPETLDLLRRRLPSPPPSALAVISNKPEGFSRHILDGLGLLAKFDLVVGGDTVKPTKPDPAPLIHVMQKLGVTPQETWMVGDSPGDIRAGRAARCHTAAVTYGLRTREELEREGPDRILDRFADLPLALGLS
jgi:phosphoglycolate phosphatase